MGPKFSPPSDVGYENGEELLQKMRVELFHGWVEAKGEIGGGVFCKEAFDNLSFRLLDHCRVFQSEATAIKVAVDVLFTPQLLSWR